MVGVMPVFLAHVPRSGGTTVTNWIAGKLPAGRAFPTGDPDDLLEQKMFPWALRNLSAEQTNRIQFYSPHLPLSTHEYIRREVRLATLVRDPAEQLQSALNLQGDPPPRGVLGRLEGVTMPWYLTHQLCWFLGADASEVLEVYERATRHASTDLGGPLDDAMASVVGSLDLVDRACSRLETIDMLALAADADQLAHTVAVSLRLPTPPAGLHLNRGPTTRWPADDAASIESIVGADRRIYEHALRLLSERAP
jgi:hypothetical protein